MFSASAVAIDRGTTATRVVWLKGSAGSLEVVKALRFVGEKARSLANVLEEMKREKMPLSGLHLGVPGSVGNLRYNLVPPVPDWRLELIMKYEAQEMAEKSGEPLSSDYIQLDVPESQAEDRILLVGMGRDSELGASRW